MLQVDVPVLRPDTYSCGQLTMKYILTFERDVLGFWICPAGEEEDGYDDRILDGSRDEQDVGVLV